MTATETTQSATTVFGGVNPIFNVKDLAASIDYYVNVLGFKIDWHVPAMMASVSRNRCGIMLCEGDQGHPGTWVWIGVADIEPLYQELTAKGAKIRHRPTNYDWAYEMQVEDPDTNVLRIGSDSKKDLPLGPFLDMHGVSWEPQPGGGWKRADGK